jgi:hypothetical protein
MNLERFSKLSNTYSLLALPKLAFKSDALLSKKIGIPGMTGPPIVLLEVSRMTPPDLYFFLKRAATDGTACHALTPQSRSRPFATYISPDVEVAHHGIIYCNHRQRLAVGKALPLPLPSPFSPQQ